MTAETPRLTLLGGKLSCLHPFLASAHSPLPRNKKKNDCGKMKNREGNPRRDIFSEKPTSIIQPAKTTGKRKQPQERRDASLLNSKRTTKTKRGVGGGGRAGCHPHGNSGVAAGLHGKRGLWSNRVLQSQHPDDRQGRVGLLLCRGKCGKQRLTCIQKPTVRERATPTHHRPTHASAGWKKSGPRLAQTAQGQDARSAWYQMRR